MSQQTTKATTNWAKTYYSQRNDKANTPAASSSLSSTQTMDKDGMYFMAPLPNLYQLF
jgi:hypothetical protein